MRIRRDAGAVVDLNGKELVRSNMPVGMVEHATPADQTAGGSDFDLRGRVRPNGGIYADEKGALAGHDINSAGKGDRPLPMAIAGTELAQTGEAIHLLQSGSWGAKDEASKYGPFQ